MLSQTDFVGCSSLHECVIEAIAEHEHVPMPVAVVIGENLLTSKEGIVCLHKMVLEDIESVLNNPEFSSGGYQRLIWLR
jgi:hypothetical protein